MSDQRNSREYQEYGGFCYIKMVKDAFYNIFFIVDSTMLYFLKYPLIGIRVQFLKTSKVKLDAEIPEPLFLSDPSHRVKVVAKHIFSIVNKSRA